MKLKQFVQDGQIWVLKSSYIKLGQTKDDFIKEQDLELRRAQAEIKLLREQRDSLIHWIEDEFASEKIKEKDKEIEAARKAIT